MPPDETNPAGNPPGDNAPGSTSLPPAGNAPAATTAPTPDTKRQPKGKAPAEPEPASLTEGIATMKARHGMSGVEARRAALATWPNLKRFVKAAPARVVPEPIKASDR